MRKLLLLALYSPLVLAETVIETPVIEITEGWKSLPIIVNDNQNYFYHQARFCPPEVIVLPHPCNKKAVLEVANPVAPMVPATLGTPAIPVAPAVPVVPAVPVLAPPPAPLF